MLEFLRTAIDEAISQSPIGVAKVAFANEDNKILFGYVANEDYYSDLLEDMDNFFVAYDGVDELEELLDGEDFNFESVSPLTFELIEERYPTTLAHYELTSNQMVRLCGCEAIAFQLSYGILIVRGDNRRLILRTNKKLGNFGIIEMTSLINNNKLEFEYPNDEGVGVIEYEG